MGKFCMYGDRDVCNLYPAVRFCCKAESVNELSLLKIKKYREDYRNWFTICTIYNVKIVPSRSQRGMKK